VPSGEKSGAAAEAAEVTVVAGDAAASLAAPANGIVTMLFVPAPVLSTAANACPSGRNAGSVRSIPLTQ